MRACLLATALAALVLAASARAQAPDVSEPAVAVERVRSIEFTGLHALNADQLAERLFTQQRPYWRFWADRPPFDQATLDADMQRIADVYREHGHYEASAHYTLKWNETHDLVSIEIAVDEGPAVLLESW